MKHGEPDNPRFRYLSRPAYRICVSRQVEEAIKPHSNGPVVTIPNGIAIERFEAKQTKEHASVMIAGKKNPEFALKLYDALVARSIQASVLIDPVPQEVFAQQLQKSDIFVGITNRTEGFFLPALEAMAAGCAVVCTDAVGNRGFCIDQQTALQPQYLDLEAHVNAVLRLVAEGGLRQQLQKAGKRMAANYSLEKERQRFYAFLIEFGLV
ncbi:MAG: glycosyltransferase family 4 protein [candidate division KSB1 bacterium]|nr:glycosyltransferase family 4 protein [candidate division KSB1 bacterium]